MRSESLIRRYGVQFIFPFRDPITYSTMHCVRARASRISKTKKTCLPGCGHSIIWRITRDHVRRIPPLAPLQQVPNCSFNPGAGRVPMFPSHRPRWSDGKLSAVKPCGSQGQRSLDRAHILSHFILALSDHPLGCCRFWAIHPAQTALLWYGDSDFSVPFKSQLG